VAGPSPLLGGRFAFQPAQFRFQFADALVRQPGAFGQCRGPLLAGGDDLAAGVALDPGSVNGKTREVTLARFAPVAPVKVKP
jgi:hypothetical protein